MIERSDPLWEDSRVLHLCQVWSRHTYLWPMIMHNLKTIYCKDFENELKSYNNKTVFHNERHWRILTIHRFSGFTWLHLAKRRRFIWTTKGSIKGNTQIRSVLEVATCCLQGQNGVEIRIKFVNKDNSHSYRSEFLMTWIKWSRTWTTTSWKPQKCSSRNER